MFSNSSPLNWHSTLRRLKKEDGMGALGKELGLKNKTLSAFVGDKTTTPVIAKATQNEVKKVAKEHKPDKKLKKQIAASGSSEENGVIGEAVGSPAAELGLTSPQASTPPGMNTSEATPRTPSVEEVLAHAHSKPKTAQKSPAPTRAPSTPKKTSPPKTTAPSSTDLDLSFHTARSSGTPATPAKTPAQTPAQTPAKAPTRTPANTKTATMQIFNNPAAPLGSVRGKQSKPARGVAAKLMAPKSVKKLGGEQIEQKKRPEIKPRTAKRRGMLGQLVGQLKEMLKQKKKPLKDLPMPDPNAVVGERRKRDYQKRGNKNDRVSEISDRQAKLAAAKHMDEIAAKEPVAPSPAKPSPAKPVEEPPAPPSPVYNYNTFRKAHAGNKWTPKRMGEQWKAWKQAHPNK
jgi:hypothetical protein